MKKEDFTLLSKAYAPIVENLIKSNTRFFRFDETIKWCFGYDEDASIMALCNKKTNIITINLKSFMDSYSANDIKTIEYFLLHEIRHVFQHSIIKDYNERKEVPVDVKIVRKWIYEENNYIKSIDDSGKENQLYFLQDLEMDAYAFSYAVMKYKYNDTSSLYVPEIYGDEFQNMVNEWLDTFKSEKL